MLDLRGRGAIVAGTRRIGAVIVERLASEGVCPAIVYRQSRREAEELYETVRPQVERAALIQADLSDEDDVKRLVAQAKTELGNVSFCLNVASGYPRHRYEDLDGAAWEQGMADAKAAFLLTLHATRAMFDNAGPTRGHVIMFGDWAAGETPYQDYVPYLTAKASVHFMTRAFAQELAPRGILVNAILPGPTMRPPDLPEAGWQQALDMAPLHRPSSAEEIAELIATLLKLETVTGDLIHVDSGRHIAGSAVRPRKD
jgi:NAD(P)-dependent dehydrogenase (short-subunit alcohol dehydrogenase family)